MDQSSLVMNSPSDKSSKLHNPQSDLSFHKTTDKPSFNTDYRNRIHCRHSDSSVKKKTICCRKSSIAKKKESFGHLFKLFCTTTSIRGVGKIYRGPLFLRILWISFVIIMTTGLIVATTYIVLEYLQYDVNINTKILIDANSSFPALTICHHHPFSNQAIKFWTEKEVQSPSEFNHLMRQASKIYLQKNDISSASLLSYLDTIRVSYQNLQVNDSKAIGHHKQSYLMCVTQSSFDVSFEDDCSKLNRIAFRTISTEHFFNCHTFEPESKDISYFIDTINIVISLNPEPDYNNHEQAFIADTFQRSLGLRVVVHERGSFPDIAKDGLHVEPGKMNEIKYQPVKHENINSPTKPCIDDDMTKRFSDLDNEFIMDKEHCIMLEKQFIIMKNCKCVYVAFPRPEFPKENVPYCGEIPWIGKIPDLKTVSTRINCLSNIVNDRELQTRLEQEKCFKRCDFLQYESTVSITKWGAQFWQLYWIRQLNQIYNKLEEKYVHSIKTDSVIANDTIIKDPLYQKWLKYGESSNLTVIQPHNDTKSQVMGTNFAYVVLQRKSKNTIVKEERLVTTKYVLMSRFGGVCSLTIGLTAGFIVEFIEFIYRYLSRDYRPHSDNSFQHDTSNNQIIDNFCHKCNIKYSREDSCQNNQLESTNIDQNNYSPSTSRQSIENPWHKNSKHNNKQFPINIIHYNQMPSDNNSNLPQIDSMILNPNYTTNQLVTNRQKSEVLL